MTKAEKIQTTILTAFAILALLSIFWTRKPVEDYGQLKKINDSLVSRLKTKDSLLNDKEIKFQELDKKDSIRLKSIKQSITNLYYEIKTQTHKNYSTPDSMYQFYIDSIRTNGGFYQIQH